MGKLTQGSQRRALEGEGVVGWEFCGISHLEPQWSLEYHLTVYVQFVLELMMETDHS